MEANQSTVLIWDTGSTTPPNGDWITVLWRSYDTIANTNSVSVPALVENDALTLREQYLAWLYDLGQTQIEGVRLIDHIVLDSGLSYWWMTLLTEKSNYSKSKEIEDAIKLMAFVNWVALDRVRRIIVHSSNKSLIRCIKHWCYGNSIVFEGYVGHDLPDQTIKKKFLYTDLPRPVQAVVWLAWYLVKRLPFKGVGTKEWHQTDGKISFFSYLCNINASGAPNEDFENRYWTKLPTLLKKNKYPTNWLHLYINDGSFKNAKEAAKALRALNAKEIGKQTHVVLDSFISRNILTKTLISWWKLVKKGNYLQKKLHEICGSQSTLNLWPLFEQDWLESTTGAVAIGNLLTSNLMLSALKQLPHQQRGIYLQENLAWESALIHSWQSQEHGFLIGFPHATVRFWDLRYFHDPRLYDRTGHHDLPMPNTVAYSGPAVLDAYRLGKYPASQMSEVEALRYLHLGSLAEPRSSSKTAQ
jgi:surface carbohydrate biosynthesis protein (TIGR04326 family)